MARKSRYTTDVPNIADMAKLYTNKTGIYARISHADGDDVSESIANQLMKFCMQAFINYTQTHELTKDIADAMLDRIEVYANKDVIVYFKFPDLSFTDSAAK